MKADYRTIQVEIRDGVAILTMNNPPVNQLSEHFVLELAGAIDAAYGDDGVKALVLTGSGDNFIAGADITQIKDVNTKARPLFEKALEIARNSMDHYYTSESLLSIGWTYLKEHNEQMAKQFQEQALRGLNIEAHPELKLGCESWQVIFFYFHEEYNQAIELAKKLIITCQKFNLKILQCRLLIILGSINWHSNKPQEAEKIWREALKISKSISEKRIKLVQVGIEMCKKDKRWVPH